MSQSVATQMRPKGVPTQLDEVGPGLDAEVIRRALQAGQAAARRTRPAHPRNYAGLTATAEATAVLREELESKGWTPYYKDGINGALHPDGSVMIMLVPGDRMTGDSGRKPRSKRRGPRGIELIDANQLSLFPDLFPRNEKRITTWYVLNHHDRRDGEIRIEVALPKTYDGEHRVCDWEQRFILEPLSLGTVDPSTPAVEFDSDENPANDPIDVPVEPIDGAFDSDHEPSKD